MKTKQHATKKNSWDNDEVKEEIRKYLDTSENGDKICGKQQRSSNWEIYRDTGLPQATRKISSKQLILPPKR